MGRLGRCGWWQGMLNSTDFAGQELVRAGLPFAGAQCFAFLPVAVQLTSLGFKDLAALAQGFAERVHDLGPAVRSMGMVKVWVAECRVRATRPSNSRTRSWCCWALAASRARRTSRSCLLYHMAGQ